MNYKKGTTMVELIIYMALLSVLLLILSQTFTTALDVQLEVESHSAVNSDGRFITARLLYDIARADAIVTPAAAGSQTTNLVLTIGGTNYTYALSGNNLTLTVGGVPENLNSYGTRVSALTFRRLGNTGGKHTIRTLFTLTSTTIRSGLGAEVRNFQVTRGLR